MHLLDSLFFSRCSYRNYICAAEHLPPPHNPPSHLPTPSCSCLAQLLSLSTHSLLISMMVICCLSTRQKHFIWRGREGGEPYWSREEGGGVVRAVAWNCCERNELRGVIIWCRAAVFLSPAAAGYQVDVEPLDVSISRFTRRSIPSSGARSVRSCCSLRHVCPLLSCALVAGKTSICIIFFQCVQDCLAFNSSECNLFNIQIVYLPNCTFKCMFSRCKVIAVHRSPLFELLHKSNKLTFDYYLK